MTIRTTLKPSSLCKKARAMAAMTTMTTTRTATTYHTPPRSSPFTTRRVGIPSRTPSTAMDISIVNQSKRALSSTSGGSSSSSAPMLLLLGLGAGGAYYYYRTNVDVVVEGQVVEMPDGSTMEEIDVRKPTLKEYANAIKASMLSTKIKLDGDLELAKLAAQQEYDDATVKAFSAYEEAVQKAQSIKLKLKDRARYTEESAEKKVKALKVAAMAQAQTAKQAALDIAAQNKANAEQAADEMQQVEQDFASKCKEARIQNLKKMRDLVKQLDEEQQKADQKYADDMAAAENALGSAIDNTKVDAQAAYTKALQKATAAKQTAEAEADQMKSSAIATAEKVRQTAIQKLNNTGMQLQAAAELYQADVTKRRLDEYDAATAKINADWKADVDTEVRKAQTDYDNAVSNAKGKYDQVTADLLKEKRAALAEFRKIEDKAANAYDAIVAKLHKHKIDAIDKVHADQASLKKAKAEFHARVKQQDRDAKQAYQAAVTDAKTKYSDDMAAAKATYLTMVDRVKSKSGKVKEDALQSAVDVKAKMQAEAAQIRDASVRVAQETLDGYSNDSEMVQDYLDGIWEE